MSTPEITAENELKREFTAGKPNGKWVTDVTEFKVPQENQKLYLSAILDLYDRYPVAYVIGARNDNRLVSETFDKATAANPNAKPLFHSDRGFQYTGKVFQGKLKEHEMEQSMSRVGHCIGNEPAEGFWGIIKPEMYQMYTITDEASLRFAISDYIRFYSEERPQDRCHCKTPSEVRREAFSADLPAEYPIPVNKRIQKYKKKMVYIKKRPHITGGRSSALHFRYLTCLLDRGHTILPQPPQIVIFTPQFFNLL